MMNITKPLSGLCNMNCNIHLISAVLPLVFPTASSLHEYFPYNEYNTNKRSRRVSVSTSALGMCAEEISMEVHTSH